ncbi:hypothetical protein NEMBOFW57_010634 [Staphylotrichum longicolle]|uniref:Mtf2-like C-terminal domain-containing protein n=1 Tax=Staphylotrichum longicolle TaxID=669026 RepID=A0AAD4ENG5_9PEZI|nr:hypothetical protein NEMBOFW57_010634 [Staphylotrichum longicolle]
MPTLLPFLYQTRTLQRLSRTGISTPAFRALLHSTTRINSPRGRPRTQKYSGGGDIPFELPEGYENPDKKFEAEEDAEGGARSTITPAERDVFSRIFEEIATRQKPGPNSTAQSAPSEDHLDPALDGPAIEKAPSNTLGFGDVDDFRVRTSEPNPESIRSTINIIVQDAAEVQSNSRRQMQNPFDPLHPLEQTHYRGDKAAQKLGVAPAVPDSNTKEDERAAAQIDLALDPLSKTSKTKASVARSATASTKMRQAQTDFELWDVLEEEVFPMVRKLGIDEDPQPQPPPGQQNAPRSATARANSRCTYMARSTRPTCSTRSACSTRSCPLLPLALHILPRVKELGPASFVLGVSTPFYNELARILWNRYGDPTAVFNLLEEMRVAGLYCDEGTRGVVQGIEQFLGSVGQGKWGPFLRELASLPEYEFAVLPRIRHWLKTINSHIAERRNDLLE